MLLRRHGRLRRRVLAVPVLAILVLAGACDGRSSGAGVGRDASAGSVGDGAAADATAGGDGRAGAQTHSGGAGEAGGARSEPDAGARVERSDGARLHESRGRRLRVRTVDFFDDGSVDLTVAYDYDGAGRVIGRTMTGSDPSAARTIVYERSPDGALLSKGDGVFVDAYTHEGGRVVGAERTANGVLAYRHDASGRLVGVSGAGFGFGGACTGDPDASPPALGVERENGRITRVVDETHGTVLTVERDETGRVRALRREGPCVRGVLETRLERDARGRLTRLTEERRSGSSVYLRRYEGDRVVALERTVTDRGEVVEVATVEYGYAADGALTSELTRVDGRVEARTTYEHEAASCRVQGSADPANALAVEVLEALVERDPAVLCGYWFDVGDF